MALTKVSYAMIQGGPQSIVDYGAIADGVTDCSAAFQRAIDAAAALTNGGLVLVPPGTYYLNATVQLKDNITIQGYGATILLGPWLASAGGTKAAFGTYSGSTLTTPSVPTATQNISVYGLTVDGQTTGIAGASIPNTDMQGAIFVFGAWGDDTPSSPTYWETIQFTNYLVQDCYFKNFAGTGVISYNGKEAILVNNRFENFFSNVSLSSGSSIGILGTQNVIIDGNRHVHTSTGYSWHGFTILDWNQISKDVVCTSNIIQDLNQGDGISCEANDIVAGNLNGGVFDGNIIENCAGDGIHVTYCIDVIISNNIIRRPNDGLGGTAVWCTGTSSVFVEGNTIEGSFSAGIWANTGILRAIIVGNRIQGMKYGDGNFQGSGIFVYDASPSAAAQVEITSNYIKDVDACGIYSAVPATVSNNFITFFGRSANPTLNMGIQANGIITNNTVIGTNGPKCSYGIYIGDGITAQFNNVSGTFTDGNYLSIYRKGYGSTNYLNYTRINTDGVTNNYTAWDTAAPVAAYWAVGDIVNNTTPTSGGNIGWVCTTAGAPGTWKTFGTIA